MNEAGQGSLQPYFVKNACKLERNSFKYVILLFFIVWYQEQFITARPWCPGMNHDSRHEP
jgi:hypothetical protein